MRTRVGLIYTWVSMAILAFLHFADNVDWFSLFIAAVALLGAVPFMLRIIGIRL